MNKITLYNDDHQKKEYDVIFEYQNQEHTYIVYTDYQNVFASEVDQNYKLSKITKDQWPEVEKAFQRFRNSHENGCSHCVCDGEDCDCEQCNEIKNSH